MELKQSPKAYVAKRLLGIVCLAIGLCLLFNMIITFRAFYDNVNTSRDIQAFWVFGGAALLLISAGVALIRKPDIFDGL